jgi:FkbM family methyltransferase
MTNLRGYVFNKVKSAGDKLGVFVSLHPGYKERHLKYFLEWAQINCVLDVGAFVGDYVLELRELGYKGRVISFEPFPESFAKLSTRLKADTSWSGQPYGLSDSGRDTVIHTYGSGDFNSLLVLKDDAGAAYHLDSDKRGQTEIQLRRLDEVLPALLEGIDSPRVFLKMDTQGHDINVLRGAARVRKWIVGLQSEMPVVPIYDGMLSMSQMIENYQSCGFVPVGFYAVNTFRRKQFSPEFDVIFNSFEGRLEWAS